MNKAIVSIIISFLTVGCSSQKYRPYQFDNGDDYFCEGLRRVVDRNGKIGFSDEKGNIVISPQFTFAFPFCNGVSKATMQGHNVKEGEHSRWVSPEWFMIDHTGKIISKDGSGNADNATSLKTELQEYIAGKDARIGIAVITDLGDTVSVNGTRDFPMMSVFKFPVALVLADKLDTEGKSLNDSVWIDKKFLREDTYSPMVRKYGVRSMSLSYRELLEWSLMESDNNACDILLREIGDNVAVTQDRMAQMGFADGITIGSSEEDMHRDPYLCYLNRSTPLAMASLLNTFDTEMRDRSASFAEIARMMESCNTGTDRLAAPLSDINAIIGHKTGTGDVNSEGRIMALNDCGYVHLPDGRHYTIAVFVADSAYGMAETAKIIANISQIVLTHMTENELR